MFKLQVLFALCSPYCIYQNHGIKRLKYYSLEKIDGNKQKHKWAEILVLSPVGLEPDARLSLEDFFKGKQYNTSQN